MRTVLDKSRRGNQNTFIFSPKIVPFMR